MSNSDNSGNGLGDVADKIPLQDLRLKHHHGSSWKPENDGEHRGTITGTEPAEWDTGYTPPQTLDEHSDDTTKQHTTRPSSNENYSPNVNVPDGKEYSPTLPDAKQIEQPVYIENHDWDDDNYSPELPDTPLMAQNGTKDDLSPTPMYDYDDPKDIQNVLPRSEEIQESAMPIAVTHMTKDTSMSEKRLNQTANDDLRQESKSASVKTDYTMVSPTGSIVSVDSTASGKHLSRKNQVSPLKNTSIRRSTSYDRDLIRRKKSIVFGIPFWTTGQSHPHTSVVGQVPQDQHVSRWVKNIMMIENVESFHRNI